jgi:hypothetical protein
MRRTLFIAAIICVFGCKKEAKQETDLIANLPDTQIMGHTWEGISFTDSVTAVPYYQFLDVKTNTTIGVYSHIRWNKYY